MSAKKTRQARQASGGARLKASGKHPQLLGWDQADWQLIVEAAGLDRRSMTQFVQIAALAAAKKILEKSRNRPCP